MEIRWATVCSPIFRWNLLPFAFWTGGGKKSKNLNHNFPTTSLILIVGFLSILSEMLLRLCHILQFIALKAKDGKIYMQIFNNF
jgi:hypothetical protein